MKKYLKIVNHVKKNIIYKMKNETKQTAVKWFMEQIGEKQPNGLYVISTLEDVQNVFKQAKEIEKEQMRLDIEKKWEQYRIITNNEDAWSFKEWLIKQTYGGNK